MKNFLLILITTIFMTNSNYAQNYQPTPNDTLNSIKVHSDGKVTLSIYAPEAKNVSVGGGDIPNIYQNGKMIREDNGVWSITVGPVTPGAYRYNFNVDGISIVDPKRTEISESNMNNWSLFYVSGKEFMDNKNIPHGAISEICYYSESLNKNRRMHIYTPPGYQNSNESYPVFYLLHGAYDSDDAWSTVGRAGFIIDNLLAENKIKPMIIVMPAGHTKPFQFGMLRPTKDEFIEDFLSEIKPFVENNYRILNDKSHTAIAGLSMGGGHTLNIAISNLQDYGYIGVFSSGIFGINDGESFLANMGKQWENNNLEVLNNVDLKKDLKLFWFATGKDDFLLETTRSTVNLLKKHDFNIIYKETDGGHTWENWRDYLFEFSQLLFK
ncbi:MAG: esterase [Ignavibacteriae bacterium]|nr:esterase [Ignavibacteriota bacterium]